MEFFGSAIAWLSGNYVELFLAMSAILGGAQIIVRLTPTQKDDGALERIGQVLSGIMSFLKIPNVKK